MGPLLGSKSWRFDDINLSPIDETPNRICISEFSLAHTIILSFLDRKRHKKVQIPLNITNITASKPGLAQYRYLVE